MNREILYRGKRADNGEWVYGYYIKKHGVPFIYENADCPQSNYEIDENTICQHTGLTDNKGTKVYEGDIVTTYMYGNCRVSFSAKYLAYTILDEDELVYYLSKFTADELEVIGNIFDSPELLTK